jgi:large subunit ribosomal protein L32
MPVPKRKTSKSRKKKRRTHWKLDERGLAKCPKCNEFVIPHRACPHCGYYKDAKVVETE